MTRLGLFSRQRWGVTSLLMVILAGSTSQAQAGLTITPTFDSSITSDPNAAAIEGAINAAIGVYESTFANPINVSIYFQEGGGLGSSLKAVYFTDYANFRSNLASIHAISGQADQASALASLPNGVNNPVTGTTKVALSTADIKALGGPSLPSISIGGNNYDGRITLNTALTSPGSPGSASQYSLQVVAMHEIDEILGLGSSLGQSFQSTPSAEDLYRYAGAGVRSYTTNSSAKAYFSVDGGNTLLAQFDNQNDGGDWGDWQSNPLLPGVSPQVQDAFGTPFSNPALGVELTALDAIGYYRQSSTAVPEPSSMALAALGAFGLVAGASRRRQK